MVVEKLIGKKSWIILIYLFGIILEIIGFASLFGFDNTMNLIHKYKFIFSLILIISGYLLAVGVRRKN
ncbi:MAG: hypothetical protein AABY22_16805 [Nanoarchaeota archaeon]